VAGCSEQSNELQGYIKYGKFFYQLSRTPLRGIGFPSVLGILPILLAMLKLQNTIYIKVLYFSINQYFCVSKILRNSVQIQRRWLRILILLA
jgi:hypothetical protein